MNPFIEVNGTYTIFTDVPVSVTPDHPQYAKIKDILDNEREDDLTPLLRPTETTVRIILEHPDFSTLNGQLLYLGTQVHGYEADRIMELIAMGRPIKRMLHFLANRLMNPSNRVATELFQFLEKGRNPITEDGNFLAYKRVREDYTDTHSGTISNRVGDVVSMPRQLVDDNPNNTCSHGLHVCSFDYIRHFSGDRLMVVEVNPRDVVSIPIDYESTKMRVCRYVVIDEIPLDTAQSIWNERFVGEDQPEPELKLDDDNEAEDKDEDGEEDETNNTSSSDGYVVELIRTTDGMKLVYKTKTTTFSAACQEALDWAGNVWTLNTCYRV